MRTLGQVLTTSLRTQKGDVLVAHDGMVRVCPVNQPLLFWRALFRGNPAENDSPQAQIKNRRGIPRERRQICKSQIGSSFVRIPCFSTSRSCAAGAECGHVEDRFVLREGELCHEVSQGRNAPGVVASMQMVTAKAQHNLGPHRGGGMHLVMAKKKVPSSTTRAAVAETTLFPGLHARSRSRWSP
jgi:hypothetical protein